MKTTKGLIIVFTFGLIISALVAAEPKMVKASDAPLELQKAVSTLSKGAETKFFRFDSDSPKVMWRVEIQGKEEKKSYLIETRESVSDGKTNVSVIKADAMRPKK